MRGRRREVEDELYRRVGEKLLHAAGRGNAVRLCPQPRRFRVAIGAGGHLDRLEQGEGLQIPLADHAAADDAGPHRLIHHRSPWQEPRPDQPSLQLLDQPTLGVREFAWVGTH